MIDVLTMIYTQFMKNDFIVANCEDRIKFYEYPETGDMTKPFIVIDPLDVPIPIVYGSNRNFANKYIYQIDVETYDRKLTKQIQNEIKKEMKALGFGQLAGGLDEYFKDTRRYVDARRYEGFLYEEESE